MKAGYQGRLLERFTANYIPEPNSGCWLWIGSLTGTGYGGICTGRPRVGKSTKEVAHRVAYKLFKGPIPEGLDLDHLCRVRSCVNPDHLEPVTRSENLKRGLGGRLRVRPSHCVHGHELTDSNTVVVHNRALNKTFRICHECKLISNRKGKARKRQERLNAGVK